MLRIGITIGDPAGVGPELIVGLTKHFDDGNAYILYGEEKILRACAQTLGRELKVHLINTPEEADKPGTYLIDLNICEVDRPNPSFTSGKVGVAYLGRAVVDAVYRKIDGLLTMPISKFWAKLAGFSFEGQTEFLAQAFGVKDYAMLMYSEGIRVALLSTHLSLKEAIDKVSKENIVKKVKLIVKEYERWFGHPPSIGVLGLNPHAGEGGTIGEEELKEIFPAVEELKSEGYMVEGPLSPDSAFLNLSYDVFFCMYHDQGLIPFKLLAFKEGVNMTLGIPFPRTSPDHGTAYDIAWKGIADLSPSLHALRLCEKLAKRQKEGNLS
ncbi:4-hydroxythreonine-4-phosphate dehydrogenase PdxA [Thermocrinis sp.]